MNARYQRLLWLWAGLLVVLLSLLFLPLTTGGRLLAVGLTAAGVAAGVVYVERQRRGRPEDADWMVELPPAPYQLPVVLVCGDTADWPGESAVYPTSQGCWLRVTTTALQQTARYLQRERPALIAQLAVMFCVQPQQHDDDAALTARLRELRWQLAQVRRDTRRAIPLLLNSTLSGASLEPLWQTACVGEMTQVWPSDGVPCSSASWLMQADGAHRLAALVRMNAFARFTQQMALSALTAATDDVPPIAPAVVLYHFTPAGAPVVADNLWQRWLSGHTALNSQPGWLPEMTSEARTLPDFILPILPLGGGITPKNRALRRAFCLFSLAAMIALCCSAWNNHQLLQRIGFDVQRYERTAMDDHAAKARAVQILRQDAAQLDAFARDGAPLALGLGLYRGERLRQTVLETIRSYVPPPPPKAVEKIVPKIIRLDSMSLFDTGKWTLKPGSTKLLVNSLLGIKARPGWLIVIAGHTDSVGDDKSNQILSLKRAESVRNWMRDTGDVPESCFAVQGYGESRPIASNEAQQGRALNRRVEISLVPQADACRVATNSASSPADGAF
ncbi:TPA: OmpA family protein [Klebsiella aerogenes]|uniref:OmpA family protein n=1 Tax=Klebsiella aerogenes TaxID=548 RepID=UPI00278AEA23|nr:OmpA family protein [Klebsiella aerogenes]MDT8882988.1 OmpA family protein [Klebsiella aerogenes]HDT1379519.1 OmpA family protein [Klebsiella aerogenes]HDU5290414.1 OmpA family protein [Klebsiella aerogenes]